MPGDLSADGERVRVHTVQAEDVTAYRWAVEQSRARIGRWNPVNPDDLVSHLAAQSRSHRTFLIHAKQPEGHHDIVGKVNVTNIVRGRFCSGAMGYDAYDPYAGRGLFAEGMRLVLGLAFADEPDGMGLHRVEAGVQPGNVNSAGVLRSLGFGHEGHSPRRLWLADADGREQWRDHEIFALTREEWPSTPYAPAVRPRITCVVNGVPGSGRSELAGRLGLEIGLPVYARDVVKEATALYRLLADSSVGGVLDTEVSPDDAAHLREGLVGAGFDPVTVPEIWCDVPQLAGSAGPQGSGPVLRVDTSRRVPDREVSRVALEVRRLSAPRARRTG